jgi:hypothetical protein
VEHHHGAARAVAPASRPHFEVGEIARAHGPSLLEQGGLRLEQHRVLSALGLCRTAALGGHLDACPDCGHERPSYNSCRNRHCPKCQALAQHRWLEGRRQRLLPVHYFHVVFTLPAELRELMRVERRRLCGQLMKTAAETLVELGSDERFLGAQLGLSAVLHTWSRDLSWHPHVHCVVTGGGLRDDGTWKATEPGFLFPVRVLGRLFRGKLLDALERLHRCGHLELNGALGALRDRQSWRALLGRLYAKDWVVYCKPPFGGVDSVYAYLGRYTHRIGLSNRRLLDVTDARVTFATRQGKHTSLPPLVFLRRFLEHTLPPGFVRIRHYGLLASSNVNSQLERARAHLTGGGAELPSVAAPRADDPSLEADEDPLVEIVRRLCGVDLRRCTRCGSSGMKLRAAPLPRGPPR